LLIEYFTGMSGIFSSAFNRTAVEKVLWHNDLKDIKIKALFW
jgi:hypothetical protein